MIQPKKKSWSLSSGWRKVVYFFPLQLLLVQIKKNHVLLAFWFLVIGLVSRKLAAKYGLPYLFLNPEYLDEVGFLSAFLVGISVGGLIMAYNIASYIMNAFRFPFLATLSNPFMKFCLNNSFFPLLFIVVYSVTLINFQMDDQFKSLGFAMTLWAGLMLGIAFFIFLSLGYFFRTNKDLYRLFNVHTADTPSERKITSKVMMKGNLDWKALNESDRDWTVETYLSSPLKIRMARGYAHYDKDKLIGVFKQNHTNAAVYEIAVVISLLVFGFFRDVPLFAIPAGATLLLLLTMYLMLTSALYNWLRGWSTAVFLALLILLNVLFATPWFNVKNYAYGMNYRGQRVIYESRSVERLCRDSMQFAKDYKGMLETLDAWRKKNSVNSLKKGRKPKLVIINATGGGMRSMLWAFHSLSVTDSLLKGELMNHTALISGASGGMIGAAYMRQIYLDRLMGRTTPGNAALHDSISRDILNPLVFTMAVNDLFLRLEKVKFASGKYKKDRGWAFENKLNENAGGRFSGRLCDYARAEKDAIIPMMVFSPNIINDGRKLYITSQDASWLTYPLHTDNLQINRLTEGIEFRRVFRNQWADSVRFLSVLRMNATFPVIMPTVNLPSVPEVNVVDAGGRDNFGVETTLKFLFTFRNWVETNTSGVLVVQVRDRYKKVPDDPRGNQSLVEAIAGPVQSLYDNIFNVQDFAQDQLWQYSSLWLDIPVEVVDLQLKNQKPDKISLSWHLTEKEKKKVLASIDLPENKEAIARIRALLE